MTLTQQTIEALRNLGFSYYQISKDTGINAQTIANWHQGKTKPESAVMIKIFNNYAKEQLK